MDTRTAQTVIKEKGTLLRRFVESYLLDQGVCTQLVVVIAKDLPGDPSTARTIVINTIDDVTAAGGFGRVFNLDKLLDGAASFELLVRYARMLDARVMPPETIPTDEVVDAALVIFHEMRATVSVE